MLPLIFSRAVILVSFLTFANWPEHKVRQESLGQLPAQDFAQLQAQAEGGSGTAQLKLARAYESGVGVPPDDQLAVRWYRKAAEQGNSEAQDILGARFLVGQGVKQNKDEAVRWFRESARRGNSSAMYHLGAAYYNGDGVPIDDSFSYAWFRLAMEAGNPRASEAVTRAESQLKAQAITNGFKKVAEIYEQGEILPENQAEAARWWSLAAARGDEDAQVALAVKMINGQGVSQDLAKGKHLCNEAAKHRDHRAEYCMGYIYEHGLRKRPGIGTDLQQQKARRKR